VHTLVHGNGGTVIVHHKEYAGIIYDDACIWHREDGPAVIWSNGRVAWYINGEHMSFNAWSLLVDLTDEEIFLLKMAYL
jgi:hypothetical protein